jgi:DNA topoisomerase-2
MVQNGIGTGYSTEIPSFKFEDILINLRLLINNRMAKLNDMVPYYKGFRGTIYKVTSQDTEINAKWVCCGVFKIENDMRTVYVSELPIGHWYGDFEEKLKELRKNDIIKSYDGISVPGSDYSEYKIKFVKDINEDYIIKELKLTTTFSGKNLHGFDDKYGIRKYEHVHEIMYIFYKTRLHYYQLRKDHMTENYRQELLILAEKARFINMVVNDQLILNKRAKADIIKDLKKNKFAVSKNDEGEDEDGYNYLLNMKISSLTKERIEELNKERENGQNFLDILIGKKIEDIWLEELDELEKEVNDYEKKIDESLKVVTKKITKKQ